MSEVKVEAGGGASIQILLIGDRRTSMSGVKMLTTISYHYTILVPPLGESESDLPNRSVSHHTNTLGLTHLSRGARLR